MAELMKALFVNRPRSVVALFRLRSAGSRNIVAMTAVEHGDRRSRQGFSCSNQTDEEIVQGQPLIDLNRAVETLFAQFQSIIDVLLHYESRSATTDWDSLMRKLKDTGREMQTIVSAFGGILGPDSALRTRLNSIF